MAKTKHGKLDLILLAAMKTRSTEMTDKDWADIRKAGRKLAAKTTLGKKHDRRSALAGIRKKIRIGYAQLRVGRTHEANDVLEEIKAMSKKARGIATKPR